MIRIQKPKDSEPAILKTKGAAARQLLEKQFDKGTIVFPSKSFDSKIYGHKKVKDKLIELQNGKCCFCESELTHTGYGDVEHFRPKAGWVQDEEKPQPPGYYWLAYDWNNLFLSCQLCNQQFKKNYFPLSNPSKRALSHHHNLAAEQPLLIHLSEENPEQFINYEEEVAISIEENSRGKATIERIGLNRRSLQSYRRKTLQILKKLYSVAKNHPATPPEIKAEAVAIVKEYYNDSKLDSTEYASMLRCFFKANPIDAL